jgi:histone H3/H4
MEKIEDKTRINKALNDLLARNLRNDPQNKSKPYDINDDAMSLLMDYASEMSCAIIESASALAQHRKSVEIDASDISLILGKKYASFFHMHFDFLKRYAIFSEEVRD